MSIPPLNRSTETMNEKPIPESYWVLPDLFLAGGYPALRYNEVGTRWRLSAFLSTGFDTFLDLTSPGDRPPYLSLLQEEAAVYETRLHYQRFSFPDFEVPGVEAIIAALNAIDAALADEHKLYLHCVGGIGRTGTTVGCWLVRHGMKPEAALRHLNKIYLTSAQSLLFPHSPETEAQARFILDWKEDGLA